MTVNIICNFDPFLCTIYYALIQLDFLVNMPPELMSQVIEDIRNCSNKPSSSTIVIDKSNELDLFLSHAITDQTSNREQLKWPREPMINVMRSLQEWVTFGRHLLAYAESEMPHLLISNAAECNNTEIIIREFDRFPYFPTDAQINELCDYGSELIRTMQADQARELMIDFCL